jgi:hypothetical protein
MRDIRIKHRSDARAEFDLLVSRDAPNPAMTTASERRWDRSRVRMLVAPLILALACLLVYNANLRQIGAADTLPSRYLPLLIWNGGTLDLGDDTRLYARGHPTADPKRRPANDDGKAVFFEPWTYWLVRTQSNQLASLYPVVTPLLVAPLYLPAAVWLDSRGWEQPHVDRVAELMEKLVASLIAAAASLLMFVILRREGNPWRLPLALAFAFGTNTWMISSQALWQHGTGEMLIALGLLLVLAPASAVRIALLGTVCVLIAANRLPNAMLAAALGAFVLWRDWRDARWLVAGAAVPMAALIYYNLEFIGHLAGGYAMTKPPKQIFANGGSGMVALLVSPTHGLLVFSPFLAFVAVGLLRRVRSPDSRVLALLLGFAVLAQLLLYASLNWAQGASWGPRWLTDMLPILIWMLAPAPLILGPLGRGVLIATIALSIGIQAVGAFWFTGPRNETISAPASDSVFAAWDPGKIPFVAELKYPPAAGELHCDAMGTIDLIGQTRLPLVEGMPELAAGAVLEGWALACARSPAQVVLLINGVVLGTTTAFLPRPDVDAAMNTRAPSGWRIEASLWGVAPGEQMLQLAIRVEPRSDFRIVREQKVVVRPQLPVVVGKEPVRLPSPSSLAVPERDGAALAAMADRAASLLREHQTDEGAWLTAHTTGPRYDTPQLELNTFLTSTLVDLLAPLARGRQLDAMLERARAHLAAQIEDDGLVRYHGLPDGPGIGTLGCAITPDADDTALVWRIAGRGHDDSRLQPMLDVLARYRDARGLYKTWLAPRSEYRCIDPGANPNPTDLAIQLNVYLMLRELAPPSAQALCTSLQRAFADGDVWVYYARAPLLPYLRVAELTQLGCPLPFPTDRLALPISDQGIWSEAAYLLVEAHASVPHEEAREKMNVLLGHVGADDFALLKRAPPLIYHNDLTANVRRYYWSEDVGYALWLRLYDAASPDAEPESLRTP